MEYDWDLQAAPVGDHGGSPSMQGFNVHDLLLPEYSPENLGGTSAGFDQLEGLYEPFHPFSTTVPQDLEMKAADHQKLKSLQSLSQQPPAVHHAAKIKKIRKNQQKRVVQNVREDGLQSDTWAWRKYGQKPIKGSPFPRSYYRCSSSKGCVARKQVERSCSDPTTFTITYTAEHNHTGPTRRSSLAGTKRNKGVANLVPAVDEAARNDHHVVMAAMEKADEKREAVGEGQDQLEEEGIMSKELVSSLEDLEALLMDQTSFLDVFPEYNWPIQDFATLIHENS